MLPTITPTGELPSPLPLRLPTVADGLLAQYARELDMLLRDTTQDLGFSVGLTQGGRIDASDATERGLVERARTSEQWQISPRIELDGSSLIVRLVVVPAGSEHAFVRSEVTTPENYQLRAVVMLRDLIRAGSGSPGPNASGVSRDGMAPGGDRIGPKKRSEGRAILAVNAAIFGGYVGYALQKSSGSDDARLTYPLLALGSGVGLGGSLIIAEEWDVGVGDAWYMSAGVVWPTVGGLLLARGRNVQPESDRYSWGLAGGLGGLTLASVSLTFAGMADGGAAVAHSGGMLGIGLGAGTELAIRGTTSETPYEGMGYGAIAGVVLGGIIGRGVEESASRVLMVDVGAGLGGLSFAAVASPLLIGDDVSETRQRAWSILTLSGAVAGGVVAYWVTDEPTPSHGLNEPLPLWYGYPVAGIIGEGRADDGSTAPAYGVGWAGAF